MGVVTVVLVAIIVADVIIAPLLLAQRANAIDTVGMLQGMSGTHWLGTDQLGRDVLARTLVAARLSVLLAVATTAIGTVIGIAVGSVPVVLGRRLGQAVVWLINLLVAFPGLLLALFLSLIFGLGEWSAVFALATAMAPGVARLTYTTASTIAKSDYVSAARLLGVPRAKLLWRHIVPNIAEPLIVNSATNVGFMLLSFAGLSYLGFGVQNPSYDWGRMLSDGLNDIYSDPAAALAPCVAIVLAGTAFILIGELGAGALTRRPVPAASARTSAVGAVEARRTSLDAVGPVDESPVLRVENLSVTFPAAGADYRPVTGVSLAVASGEIVGIVGESGSGKSLTASAISALIPATGTVDADRLELCGKDLRTIGRAERNRLLGTSLATVFQDPMSALNPAVRVGRQLAEVSTVHQGMSRRSAMARAIANLRAVRIPRPERRAHQYPSEFSGGMRQRAMIGMGLMGEPRLIIADEPTTALDVTVQRDVLALLRQVSAERGAAVLFISHDIAVISQIASRVLVMYAGRVVEDLPVSALIDGAAHPYTRALVSSIPDMTTDRDQALVTITGRPPRPDDALPGCSYAARCPFADATCRASRPPLVDTAGGRRVACWKPQDDNVARVSVPLVAGEAGHAR